MPGRIKLVKEPYAPHKALIRMSWSRDNLFALATRTRGNDHPAVRQQQLRRSVFQQRWIAKRELRAYHVPNITERQLLDRHFRTRIPLQHLTRAERERVPPIQALAFAELERRLDTVVFRCHFASSIWAARRAVVHGHVKVNGKLCRTPCRRLEDGDMITVDPNVIPTLEKVVPSAPSESDSKDAEPKAQETNKTWKFKYHPYMGPWMFIPEYLEVNYRTCSAIFLRSPLPQPDRMEIPSPHPPSLHQLVFEWYATIQRRRKQGMLARMKNRTKVRPKTKPLVVDGRTVLLKPKFDRMVRHDQRVERLKRLDQPVVIGRKKIRFRPRRIKRA
ncbi:mitochondrial 37S ribosomal protein nam9 [Quaeritorhiza haematococci]|nr:mitochondrial 37S ribosomal protein nam9 [Quaeritorhiza haematococci]